MGIKIIRARSRAGENNPQITMFNSKESAKYWKEKGYRSAKKAGIWDDVSLTIQRKQKADKLNYTPKILCF